jgi:hypothetical protein
VEGIYTNVAMLQGSGIYTNVAMPGKPVDKYDLHYQCSYNFTLIGRR